MDSMCKSIVIFFLSPIKLPLLEITVAYPRWQLLYAQLKQQPGSIVGVAPFIEGQAMLAAHGSVYPALVTGILPHYQQQVSDLEQLMSAGRLTALKEGRFGIVVGVTLARELGLQLGDKVTLITPRANISPLGIVPVFKRLTVVGLFQVGGNVGADRYSVFMNLIDAQHLFGFNAHQVSGLRLKVPDLYSAPHIAARLAKELPRKYHISDWSQRYESFFKAIAMEKMMMFIILLLIVAVAGFNLVSGLVMLVIDKRTDIAVLRTLGARTGSIMAIFILQGCIIGGAGILLGLIGGITLSTHITAWVRALESWLHVQLIPASVYFVNYLPSQLQWQDVWQVCGLAMLMSFVATWYPAWQATRVKPAEVLRYD